MDNRPAEQQPPRDETDNSNVDMPAEQELSEVRSGDLASRDERQLPARVEDSTAITPGRAIPPAEVSAIMSRYGHVDPMEALIPVLQEIQYKFGYITQDVADQVSEGLGMHQSDVYSALTFYSFFRYTPRGGHVIMTCEGTGCYVRGAAKLREAIENRLGIGPGETTADGMFTFEPQSICLGSCDLGPLVEIEGTYYAHVTPERMDAILTQWAEAGDEKPVGDGLTGGHVPAYEENHGFGPSTSDLYAGYEVEKYMAATERGGAKAPVAAPQTPVFPGPEGTEGSGSDA